MAGVDAVVYNDQINFNWPGAPTFSQWDWLEMHGSVATNSSGQGDAQWGSTSATGEQSFNWVLAYKSSGPVKEGTSQGMDEETVMAPDYLQETAVELSNETHSGADVALYATGPRAHWFGGSIEQNTVFHLISAALGWPRDEDETAVE